MASILLTNDDGINAQGLRALEESLRGLARVIVVAPDRERSAVSHGLTIHAPLSLRKVSPDHYTLDGTPADCVIYALMHVVQHPPELVISGINHGANLGDDIMYSGTVAAAREASRHGIDSLAISQAYSDAPIRFDEAAAFARALARLLLQRKPDGGVCLNVNIPVRTARGVKITRQGCDFSFPHLNSLDREKDVFNIPSRTEGAKESQIPLDFRAVIDDYISITPLQRDQTDYATVESLREVFQ